MNEVLFVLSSAFRSTALRIRLISLSINFSFFVVGLIFFVVRIFSSLVRSTDFCFQFRFV